MCSRTFSLLWDVFLSCSSGRSTTPFIFLSLELQSLSLEHHGLLQEEFDAKKKHPTGWRNVMKSAAYGPCIS